VARASLAKPLIRLTLAAVAIGLFAVGYYWGNQHKRRADTPSVIEGVLVRPPVEIPSFDLRGADGEAFTVESVLERWTLLAFGDPSQAKGHLTIGRMIEVRNRIATDPDLQEMLQLVLVTERQDPTLAGDFKRLTPALRLLSGEPREREGLRASLGAPSEAATQTAVDGTPMYLIGPTGRLLVLFPGTQPPASIASDLSAIAAHAETLFPDKAQDNDVPSKGSSQDGQDAFPRTTPPPDSKSDMGRTWRDFSANV